MDTLGKRLKHVRENVLRLSQAKLAAKLDAAGVQDGTTNVSVMRYERDERMPGADYVREVAKLGDVDAGWLLLGDKEKPASAEERGRDASLQGVTDGERLQILALLDAVRGLVAGTSVPPVTQPISPETLQYFRAALRRLDEIQTLAPGGQEEPPANPGHKALAG